ncbi:gp53-like domain-containing protein [Asaia bogorensis]|uniref:Putative tail fiber protein gp53-like C-terminal domain-containing protein n=1 Tax=Asaia bogorensis NBRC 16594 TaxID=1231624 RepID=A0AAN4U394_9PROT|nr:hypothetical protein [Asaia bogorensis]BAT19845.1 hypothetical protein Asbog_01572 [Asaia bogorensis NBRC 16594]GBQ77499.1 hypothetical protein AA0311_1460 [Asaia bogorensis NBRC 16594]GEL54311.1 hypothetical protein ABO01nite_23180 [Asaia bogorensis NBRC 16594]
MDRKIIYPGQIPMVEDQLQAARFTQIGVGRLAGALYDESGTGASGFACTPGSGLSVTISPGQIIQPGMVDASEFGVLPASASALPRQYVLTDPVNIVIPGTGATYIVYGTVSTADTANAVLPYYNSANPSQTFAGVGNNGQNQPTVRADSVTIGVATSVPSGSIPLWSIVIPSGATAITSAMISAASGAPLYPSLRGLAMRSVAPFNANLAAAFKGYPSKAIVADPTTTGVFWVSTADNNLTTPGASGASWTSLFAGLTPTPVATSGNGSLGVLSLYSANAGRMYAQTYNSDGTSSAKILAVADSTATSTTGKIGYTINGLTATPVEVSGTVSLKISNLYTAGSDGRLLADTYTSGGASITQTIALAASATKSSLGTLCFSINGVTGTGIEISGTSSLQVSRLYTAGSDSRLLADTYTSAGASVTRTIPYAASSSKSSTGVLGYTINGTVPTSLETTGTGALNVNYLYALGSTGRLWANTTNSAGTSVSKQIITSDQFTITDNGVSGYRITPDGSVEQWGIITLAASNQVTASGTITFPFNFPNRCRSICFTPLDPANSSTGCWPSAGSNGLPGKTSVTVSADTLSQGNSSQVVFNQSVRIMWEARGL